MGEGWRGTLIARTVFDRVSLHHSALYSVILSLGANYNAALEIYQKLTAYQGFIHVQYTEYLP